MCNKGLPDENEDRIEVLEKKVRGIEEFYARKKEIPDVSPYLERAIAEETYATKEKFERITGFIRKLINNTRDRITKQREELDEKIGYLREKVDTKYGSDEVYTSIMYILKLYDKGELPGFNN